MRRPSPSPAVLVALALAALGSGCRPEVGEVGSGGATTAAALPPAAGYSLYDLRSEWRDQRGHVVRLPALAGKVRVVAMVYTSCQVTCPLIVADLKRIERALPPDRRGDVGFVLVSIDPERDTPGQLAAWAERTELDPARWTLLAGDDEAVRELAASLDVRYQAQPDGELAHTNAVTVLDHAGGMVHRQLGLGDTDVTIRATRALLR